MLSKIQFSHANGFPASSYQYFFELLRPFPIDALSQYGHKRPVTAGWHSCKVELIQRIESTSKEPVIGVGHSLGAVITLFAALERPDLFQRIILLDPPLFRPSFRAMMYPVVRTNLVKYFPPASKARTRRTHFSSHEEALAYFQGKALFRHFHPTCLQDYVKFGLKPTQSGFELAFSAQVELDIFCNPPCFLPNLALQTPTHLLFSQKYEVLKKADLKWWKKHFPQIDYHAMTGGHLFPFEQPHTTAKLIRHLIQNEMAP